MSASGPAKPKTMQDHFATFKIPLAGQQVSIFTDPLAISTQVQKQFVEHLEKVRFIGENWDFLSKVQALYATGEPSKEQQIALYNQFIKKGSPGELNFGEAELASYRAKGEKGELTKEDFISLTARVWDKLIFINLNDADYKKINTKEYTAMTVIDEHGDILKRQVAICDTFDLLKKCADQQKELLKNNSSALNPLGAYQRFRTGIEACALKIEKRAESIKQLLGNVDKMSDDDLRRHLINAAEDLENAAKFVSKFQPGNAQEQKMQSDSSASFNLHAGAVNQNVDLNISPKELQQQFVGLEQRINKINPTVNAKPWTMQIEIAAMDEEKIQTRSRSTSPNRL